MANWDSACANHAKGLGIQNVGSFRETIPTAMTFSIQTLIWLKFILNLDLDLDLDCDITGAVDLKLRF